MKFSMKEKTTGADLPQFDEATVGEVPVSPAKSRWERSWPTIACGAGLFSDGYLNGYATIPPGQNILSTLLTLNHQGLSDKSIPF